MATATEVREPQVEDRVNVWEAARVQPTRKTLPIPQLQRPLFADSLLDSGQQEKTRRRFAVVLSFTFQRLWPPPPPQVGVAEAEAPPEMSATAAWGAPR